MSGDASGPVVVTYRDEYREHFEALNREWIERWFHLEPRDLAALGDPRGTYLAGGGEVFFVLADLEVRGTCALRGRGRIRSSWGRWRCARTLEAAATAGCCCAPPSTRPGGGERGG
jgi:hypothetical protein